MNLKQPKYIGIFLGVLYGLSIRILWEQDRFNGVGDLVTISFMFFVPFVIGFIRVYFESKITSELTFGSMITVAWQPIFIFLLTTVFTLLEGSICVLIALPAFMFFASLGGVTAGYLTRHLRSKGTLTCVAIIPFITAPIELHYLELSKTYQVTNTITINASPAEIWQELGNVKDIKSDELPYSITKFLGIPSPKSAVMSGSGEGSIRTSYWDKGVVFKEIITDWKVNKYMGYDFDIDPDVIPDHALDKHVKLGGEYFSPISGKYEITPINDGNTSSLSLSTIVKDNTNFGVYSRLWGELIFNDFHNSLLHLIKNRSEKPTS